MRIRWGSQCFYSVKFLWMKIEHVGRFTFPLSQYTFSSFFFQSLLVYKSSTQHYSHPRNDSGAEDREPGVGGAVGCVMIVAIHCRHITVVFTSSFNGSNREAHRPWTHMDMLSFLLAGSAARYQLCPDFLWAFLPSEICMCTSSWASHVWNSRK